MTRLDALKILGNAYWHLCDEASPGYTHGNNKDILQSAFNSVVGEGITLADTVSVDGLPLSSGNK